MLYIRAILDLELEKVTFCVVFHFMASKNESLNPKKIFVNLVFKVGSGDDSFTVLTFKKVFTNK